VIVDGCAHCIAEDRPARFVAEVRAHLEEDARVGASG
jgi:hypothetical protein